MRACVVWRALILASLLCFPSDAHPQSKPRTADGRLTRLQQARTLLNANDLEGARAAVEGILAENPGSAEAHDLLGFILGKQGHTDEALAEFERAVQLNPGVFDAQYHLGATRW